MIRTKLFLCFLLQLLTCTLFAQYVSLTGQLGDVKELGLHYILLNPEIRGVARDDYADLRLYNASGDEIPYYVQTKQNEAVKRLYKPLSVLNRSIIKEKKSTYIIQVEKDKILDHLVLKVANSLSLKTLNISGSINLKEWYGVLDHYQFQATSNNIKNFNLHLVSIPKTSYRYLKIELDNYQNLPINIESFGYYEAITPSKSYVNIPNVVVHIEQLKPENVTRLQINNTLNTPIDLINFNIKSPKFYNRDAVLFINENVKSKDAVVEHIIEKLQFTLNSKSAARVETNRLKYTEFFIDIHNNDDLPVAIDSLNFYQEPQYIVANFNQTGDYKIVAGNHQLRKPEYDLKYFENEHFENYYQTKISDIKVEVVKANTPQKPKNIFEIYGYNVMWIGILIGGLIAIYFSMQLLIEMNKNKSDKVV